MRSFARPCVGAVLALAIAVLAGACTQGTSGQPDPAPTPAADAFVVEPATLTVTDARGDMWADPQGKTAPAPNQRHGDIRRVVFTSDARTVGVRVRFEDLTRRGVMSELEMHVRTNTGAHRVAILNLGQISPRGWQGDTDVVRHPTYEVVHCDASHAVDYRNNTILLSIARNCLGEPLWVQTRVVSYFGDRHAQVYVDRSRTDQADRRIWTRPLGHR